MQQAKDVRKVHLPSWLLALYPLVILLGFIGLFYVVNPLRPFAGAFPPLEELTVQRVTFPEKGQIQLDVINGGPDPVTIAQVLVDDAYWHYEIEPGPTLARLGRATIHLSYPWVRNEPLPIVLISSTGITFDTEVNVAVESPRFDGRTLLNYALLGFYVGVIPVGLGMLWYPFMRQMSRRLMDAILALTVGLLLFLFFDTVLEALELAAEVPGVFQGAVVVLVGTLLSLGILQTVGRYQSDESPYAVAWLMALGIGLHNLGEGLAIGAAFATGAAALGSFLVIGFTLHNITEGIGIAAPLVRGAQPRFATFLWLALLAGAPAILGTWIGGLAFSPFLATLFLSLGAGAILQVIWEVGKLLLRHSQRDSGSALTWLNLAGLTAGVLVMYLTAFLVSA